MTSLTFNSSSSQPRSSPFGSSSNDSPPLAFTSGEQAHDHIPRPDVLDIVEHGLEELFLQGGNEEDDGWKELVNFDGQPADGHE